MKVTISGEYSKYRDFIESIPHVFDTCGGETLKDRRNSVKVLHHDGKAFVVKRFKRVNCIQSVVYSFFRPTKAERAYRFAQEMRRRGISTPREIAYMEQTRCGLFSVGYFVSEQSMGVEAFTRLVDPEEFCRPLADAIAGYVVFMHSRGVLHGDLNSANFLFVEDGKGGYKFDVIDTNRSHFCDGMPTDEQCLENLKRFTHRRDLYEYFIRQYAIRRGWDENATVEKAVKLLERFENRKIKL